MAFSILPPDTLDAANAELAELEQASNDNNGRMIFLRGWLSAQKPVEVPAEG